MKDKDDKKTGDLVTPKLTKTEMVRRLRKQRKEAGLKPVQLYMLPAEEKLVRAYLEKIRKKPKTKS